MAPTSAPNESEYPKVLVITSNPISKNLSQGIAVGSLFEGWPAEKFAQIYFRFSLSNPPDYIPGSYFRIGLFGNPKRIHFRKNVKNPIKSQKTFLQIINDRAWIFLKYIRQNAWLSLWLRLAHEIWYSSTLFSRSLQKQIELIKPDIIYTATGNYCLSRVVTAACVKFQGPLFLHAGDDFIESLYDGMPFARFIKPLSNKWYHLLVDRSTHRAAISEVMAEEYQQRYGVEWSVLPTLVDSNIFNSDPRSEDNVIRLTYAGNLGLGRSTSLKLLSMLLSQLQADIQKEIVLEIYSSSDQIDRFRKEIGEINVIKLKGWVPQEKLPTIFYHSDLLVHVESTDPKICRYTRLSLSTKLSQYMSAGRCILALGQNQKIFVRSCWRMKSFGKIMLKQGCSGLRSG